MNQEQKAAFKAELHYRTNSDDDKFVIPEIVDHDMFRLDLLSELAKPKDSYILDCGAHIGIMTLFLNAHFPDCHIFAYEPNPDNFELLKQNTQNHQNIGIFNQAVGIENSEMKLYKPNDPGKSGRWTLTRQDDSPHITTDFINVKVINLLDVIDKLDKPIFLLKLDLEGYEATILEHMTDAQLAKVQILIIEEHHVPINSQRFIDNGFVLMFNPFNHARHYVYMRKDSPYYDLEKILQISRTVSYDNFNFHYQAMIDEINQLRKENQHLKSGIMGKLRQLFN